MLYCQIKLGGGGGRPHYTYTYVYTYTYMHTYTYTWSAPPTPVFRTRIMLMLLCCMVYNIYGTGMFLQSEYVKVVGPPALVFRAQSCNFLRPPCPPYHIMIMMVMVMMMMITPHIMIMMVIMIVITLMMIFRPVGRLTTSHDAVTSMEKAVC